MLPLAREYGRLRPLLDGFLMNMSTKILINTEWKI